MSNLPIVIQLLEVDLPQSRILFKVYNLDRSYQTVQGSINDLIQYVNQARHIRQFGLCTDEALAEHEQRLAALVKCDRDRTDKQIAIAALEANAKQDLEQFKAAHPAPVYDKRAAATVSSQEKYTGLLIALAVAGFGAIVTLTGEGALSKTLGVGCVLGGSLVTYGSAVCEVDNSSYAKRQRQLRQTAEQLQQQQQTLAQNHQAAVNIMKRELQVSEQQRDQLQQQVEVSETFLQLSDLLQQINQSLGDGILYGSEAQFQALEFLSMKQQATSEAFAQGLAGAALVGLMVVGAFAGIGP